MEVWFLDEAWVDQPARLFGGGWLALQGDLAVAPERRPMPAPPLVLPAVSAAMQAMLDELSQAAAPKLCCCDA